MFEVLLASGPHPPVRTRWLTTSVATHLAVFALVVIATQARVEAPQEVVDRAITLILPKAPDPAPPEPIPVSARPSVIVTDPPPRGFQTLIPPTEIPNLIPAVDVNQRPLDPRDFTGRGTEGGVADGVVGGRGPVNPDAIYEATTIMEGFEPAAVVSQPMPRYPPSLEAAGLEGRVMVEFVIDTAGRVEPQSIRAIERTHSAFEAAARAAVRASVFRPARLGAHPVRQLTQQMVRFVAAQ